MLLWNFAEFGDVGDKYSIFWFSSGRRTYFTMKYVTATPALMEGILKAEEY